MRWLWVLLVVMLAGPAWADAVPLNGPWAFRMGNDAAYAQPSFDDSAWERVDLTPKPGAHDGDVGLPRYVPGWTARGHKGGWGHAWYRLHVRGAGAQVLVAPPLVDGAYQIFWNGRPVGGIGDVGAHPKVFASRPKLIAMPAGDGVVAIHVFLPEAASHDAEAGGIHIAPVLADPEAGQNLYLAQWWRTFWGYAADFIEPVLLWIAALYALSVGRFRKDDRFFAFAAATVAAIAASRINQAVFFWGEVETLPMLIVLRYVVFNPLAVVMWVIASGRAGAGLDRRAEIAACALGVVAGIAALPFFGPGGGWDMVVQGARFGLLALAVWGAVVAVREVRGWERVWAVATLAAMAVALFPGELSMVGVPGIWFPWGVGVSRTQYALLAVLPLMCGWLHVRAGAALRLRHAADKPAA